MKLTVSDIVTILELVEKYGIPAISDALDHLLNSGSPDPTVDQVKAILEGVEPPVPNP